MRTIVVTGGSGKAGRAVVADLHEHGYQLRNVDLAAGRDPDAPTLDADLTDLGQTIDALKSADAVVHLAAIPAPNVLPDEATFRVNTMSTYNVFSAAVTLGMERVVWASSETLIGLPFDREAPRYAPIDEDHPRLPESHYALSKLMGENMAGQFSRWSDVSFVGLRISNIMEPHDYARFPGFSDDPMIRRWNLWGYVDARDVAQACRRGLEAGTGGSENFLVAAADTCMQTSSAQLMADVFPDVPVRKELGEFETLLSIDKARSVLGYEPTYTWRNQI
ncbi:MAG: NAD(P)-dependent oxidoreductase [Acidimicrobiia bacterium]|nr:NAD(P)-dependent oxidoreductase [Acidimicrobiia bacterium]